MSDLSHSMKKALCDGKSRYLPPENLTMRALQNRGLVQWVTSSWSDPHPYWMTTEKGAQMQKQIRAEQSKEYPNEQK